MKPTDSAQAVYEVLAGQSYLASSSIATICFLAIKMQRPVLVEGPAGVGKTELARALSQGLGTPLIHLQCYEGLDETKAIYEWEYAKQLLYTQMLKEKIHQLVQDTDDLSQAVQRVIGVENAFFSEHFLLPRPLLKAITSDETSLLLIDEIDKSDPEFEAYLLEVLSTYQITIPELGSFKAKHPPLVFLTSNAARDLSDALKRRCLHLYIDFPEAALERQIVQNKFPGLEERLIQKLVTAVGRMRGMDLKKKPSIAETLDWAHSLLALGANELTATELEQTLGVISKHASDAAQILEHQATLFAEEP